MAWRPRWAPSCPVPQHGRWPRLWWTSQERGRPTRGAGCWVSSPFERCQFWVHCGGGKKNVMCFVRAVKKASTIRAVATCEIPAARSSDWEARTGVEAADATAVSQSPECPGASTGSSRCWSSLGAFLLEDTERGRFCNPRWRRPNAVPPLEKQMFCHGGVFGESEETFLPRSQSVGGEQGDALTPSLVLSWTAFVSGSCRGPVGKWLFASLSWMTYATWSASCALSWPWGSENLPWAKRDALQAQP